MKKVFYYLKPYRYRMAFGFVVKVLGTFMDLGLPWVLAYIIDSVVPKKNVPLILWWGAIMIALAVGARTFNIIANRMASKVARNAVEVLRHDLFDKILSLSGTQLDYFTVPSLESRMTTDTYNIHNMIGVMQRIGVRAPIILIGGIIITSTLEPVLTLVLLGVLPFLAFVVFLVSKKGIPYYTQLQISVDRMIRIVRENITGIRIIKALSKTQSEKNRFDQINSEVSQKEQKAGMTMAITNPVMNLLLNLGLTLVVTVGAYRVNSGASEPGKIVAFLSYFTIMLQAVMAITRIFVVYSKASASASRIAEVLDTEEDLKVMESNAVATAEPTTDTYTHLNIDEVVTQSEVKFEEGREHISFDHVYFSYAMEPCLTDIHFSIPRGGSLGIIGSTGSGKTTLINLLMRFYDVGKGEIRIDGRNIRSIDKRELRKKFGVAFQNDILFADTVYENISMGRELDKAKVQEGAEHAQASFVDELDQKLDYRLAIKGSNLSGGQKQRLLIARALAGDPEIIILDDSSSALDYKTDAQLRQAIRNHYKDTTTIVIAQRISSVMKLDHILVLEDGHMVGYGSHEELINTCEVYQEIYQSQLMS